MTMAGRIDTGIRPKLKTARPKTGRRPKPPRTRLEDSEHLKIIRQLPCLVSGKTPAGEAAHIRYASAIYGKPVTGIGVKPDDKWVVPLCAWFHTISSEAQHRFGEEWWWEQRNIDPLFVASKLYAASVTMRDARMAEPEIVQALGKIVLSAYHLSMPLAAGGQG